MTRYYVNEREITPPPGITSFDEILKHVDGNKIPPNSVVRLVSIDGNPLLQEDFTKDSDEIIKQIENGEKVEIITGTVEEIVRDSLAEAFAYIDRAEKGIPALAKKFQTDPGPESFEGLRQLYEGFYWLSLLLKKLSANFNIPVNDISIQGETAGEHHRKFIVILKQLLDSQGKGDVVLISDLLEYEIAPLIPVWKEMFHIIAEKTGTAR